MTPSQKYRSAGGRRNASPDKRCPVKEVKGKPDQARFCQQADKHVMSNEGFFTVL